MNVAAATADTDAVILSQLKDSAQSVADALGGGSTVNADGTVTAPDYVVDNTTVHSVGDAITNLDGRTTSNTANITNLQNKPGWRDPLFKANGNNDGSDDAAATGTGAVAIGAKSQASANHGTALGYGSKSTGTAGGTAVGYNASTINGGVAVGSGAGSNAISTYRSVYVGDQAGWNAQTNSNVGVGYSAGQNVTAAVRATTPPSVR